MVWFFLSLPTILDVVDFFARIFSEVAVTVALVLLILSVLVAVFVFSLLSVALIVTL